MHRAVRFRRASSAPPAHPDAALARYAPQFVAERTKIKSQLAVIREKQSLLDAYEGEGWKGSR